jgi:PAP_fibrillin
MDDLGDSGTKFSRSILQVYQGIEVEAARLDNIVELDIPTLLPRLPVGPEVQPIVASLTLRHTFEVVGPSTVEITFEGTELQTTGATHGQLQPVGCTWSDWHAE